LVEQVPGCMQARCLFRVVSQATLEFLFHASA